jgi:hypothetical protein
MGKCIEWTENPYKFKKGQSIYTTPPAQPAMPLTDEQKAYFVNEICALGTGFVTPLFAIVNAIEKAAHGVTTHPPTQPADHGDELTIAYLDGVHTGKKMAKREWVGLTNEQANLLINGRGDEGDDDYVEPTGDGFGLTDEDLVKLIRRVEAHHGIGVKP